MATGWDNPTRLLDDVRNSCTRAMLAFHRKSFKPIYYQISDLIESGQLPPNSLLPSERELMQSHRISRNTARQSLDLLVKKCLSRRSELDEKGRC